MGTGIIEYRRGTQRPARRTRPCARAVAKGMVAELASPLVGFVAGMVVIRCRVMLVARLPEDWSLDVERTLAVIMVDDARRPDARARAVSPKLFDLVVRTASTCGFCTGFLPRCP